MTLQRLLLIAGLLAACLALPPAGKAQQQGVKLSRIGVLMNLYSPDAAPPQALRKELRDLGYVEGQNLAIDWRYQLGQSDRLPALAAELISLKPDVIVADVTVAIRAAMRATSTVPIVMAASADAVESGLVANLARPGSNVTGVTIMLAEMTTKRLQVLREVVPNATRIAVLWDPAIPWHRALLKEVDFAAPRLRLQPVAIAVRNRDELGDTFSAITKRRAEAIFVSHTTTPSAQRQLVAFASKSRLPTMFMSRHYVEAGGLASYGPNFMDGFRHAARYVDKILKGSRPGDLPVEQPMRFELTINANAAKALGLTLTPSVLTRVDELIQ
jgi:ABC-type uncharacterized transport system substrate-binding protein